MNKILVTGGTGLVGNNVVRLLIERGHAVRALAREGSDPRPFEGLEIEIVRGDVCDAPSVVRACQGVEAVIHSAGYVHLGWSGMDRHQAVNVEGVRHVAQAAREAGVRMVHVSSVDALGMGKSLDEPADEESPRTGALPVPYVVTKRAGEEIVRQMCGEGLEGVIVNPTYMLGPWDWKPSSGRMLLAVGKQFTPLAPPGGNNFADVRDVAAGILLALEHGQSGRQYILGGENLTYLAAWKLFAEVTGGWPPIGSAGPVLPHFAGYAGSLWGSITGSEPDVNRAAVRMAAKPHYYTSARAEAELGYTHRPIRDAATDAWQWFKQHGYA